MDRGLPAHGEAEQAVADGEGEDEAAVPEAEEPTVPHRPEPEDMQEVWQGVSGEGELQLVMSHASE